MPQKSCLNHPTKEPLIIIRLWQLEFCEGNIVAAALLSFFAYWHDIKLDIQANARAKGRDASLLQHHTEHALINGILKIVTSRSTLRQAIKYLEKKVGTQV